jgi:hypothetical protein
MRRLARRNRRQAIWLGSNIAVAAIVWLTLFIGLTALGVYVAAVGVTDLQRSARRRRCNRRQPLVRRDDHP